MADPRCIEVKRTYLEMKAPSDLRPARRADGTRASSGSRDPRPRSTGTSTPRSAAPAAGWTGWAGRTTRSAPISPRPACSVWLLTVSGARRLFRAQGRPRRLGRDRLLRPASGVHRTRLRQAPPHGSGRAGLVPRRPPVWLHTCTLDGPPPSRTTSAPRDSGPLTKRPIPSRHPS